MILLRRAFPTVTALALAATFALTPAHAKTPAELCSLANETVNTLSGMVPIEVDSVTQTTGVVTDCGQTRVQFQRTVDLDLASMESDFKDFLQKQDNEYACGDATLKQLIAAGWTLRFAYRFQSDAPVTIEAKCGG